MFDLKIDTKKEVDSIVTFIKTTLQKTGFKKLVIGLSGGVDSTVSATLAVKAIGVDNLIALILPYGELSRESTQDAKLVSDFLKIKNFEIIDIKKAVDSITGNIKIDNIRKGNIIARVRMIFLYDYAKKENALVLGTENRSEHLLGYFTRFGDEASDMEPIIHLYKTQVINVAKSLHIPEKIINKPPSANLWLGQKDEGEFGFTYEDADRILQLYIDKKVTVEEIIKVGFDNNIMDKVIDRYLENNFKHKLPYRI
jgi:NAD+ synthase